MAVDFSIGAAVARRAGSEILGQSFDPSPGSSPMTRPPTDEPLVSVAMVCRTVWTRPCARRI
jgi:hypothetical protein